jgi:predicted SnoaL-like aldol condensation-catalyzing enzyme
MLYFRASKAPASGAFAFQIAAHRADAWLQFEEMAMSAEENKRLVRRFYEAIDRGDLNAMDEFVAEDYVDHNPPPFPGLAKGRDGLKQLFKTFSEATPRHHEIEDQIAEATKSSPVWPPMENMKAIFREHLEQVIIADGKLAEKWSEKDVLGFLKQIGVMP